jgi:hypothetical protein
MIARSHGLALLFLLAGALPALGQDRADLGTPWFIRFEGGAAEIHDIDDPSPTAGVRVGRYLDRRQAVGLTLGAAGGGADAGYATLALGLELQLPGQPRITPILGGRAGLLLEEGFGGEVLEANAGLAYRIGTGKWLRVSVHVGRHSDADGPNSILFGFQAPL